MRDFDKLVEYFNQSILDAWHLVNIDHLPILLHHLDYQKRVLILVMHRIQSFGFDNFLHCPQLRGRKAQQI